MNRKTEDPTVHHRSSLTLAAALAASLALTACDKKHEHSQSPTTKAQTAPTTAPTPAEQPPVEQAGVAEDPDFYTVQMMVHPTIASACQVVAAKAFFPYDSAKLSWGDRQVVEQVSTCLTTGALKDARIRLVGRSDPRGPADYNQKLGRSRADAVADALAKEGINRDRIEVVSRGERGTAAADSRFAYALARRVDMQLVDPEPKAVELTWWDADADGRINRAEFYTWASGIIGYDDWDADKSGGLDARETRGAVLGTWDADGDGAISKDEWGSGAKGMFPEDGRFGTFESWDANTDGRIEGTEWDAGFTGKQIHGAWDADDDDLIYDYELAEVLFGGFDKNEDKSLSEDEWRAADPNAWRRRPRQP